MIKIIIQWLRVLIAFAFLGGLILLLITHFYIGLIAVIALWIGFVIFIFWSWGSAEDAKGADMIQRYGENPQSDENGVFKCLPCKPMVKEATSTKNLGFVMPEYEIVDSVGIPPNFTGDFWEKVTLRLKETLSPEIVAKIKAQMKKKNSRWSIDQEGAYLLTLSDINLGERRDRFFTVKFRNEIVVIEEGRI